MRRPRPSTLLFLVLFGGMALWVLAALRPIPTAPLAVQRWLPLPLACADARCVTYVGLARVAARVGQTDGAADLLTALLTNRAVVLVARRSGLTASREEVEAAAAAIADAARSQPDLRAYLVQEYGSQMLEQPSFRSGLRTILLRQKLAAAGVSSPWVHPAAPVVTILHARYRWDATKQQVVER